MLSPAAAKAHLDALYAELPEIDCQRKCESSCGPILMSYIEWHRIIKKLGYEPRMRPNPADPRSMNCPMLRDGLCTVYAMRPMICRLWGLVETMPCPWGCKPERVLSTREGYIYLQRAAVIGASSGEEARQEQAVLDAIMEMPDEQIKMSEMLHVQPTKEER